MKPRVNNYAIQAQQAKKLFLTYGQQELIRRCQLSFDETYLYTMFLSEPYRIHRSTGDMERQHEGCWIDGNSFGEVMTILDWLCDSREDRFISGEWINIISAGPSFHRSLQEDDRDPDAAHFDREPEAFSKACEALGGEKLPGADIGYAIELVDGLRIFVQLWHGDAEFAPRLRCLWDKNVLQYLRYETTFYAVGLLMSRLKEYMI